MCEKELPCNHNGLCKNHLCNKDEKTQRRTHERIYCEVNISIRDLKNYRELEAKSTDISQGGIGIISPETLRPGDKFELWIHLADGLDPVHRFGKVVWARESAPFGCRGGIRFSSLVDIAPHLQSA